MVIDSSAILAIVFEEQESFSFALLIDSSIKRKMSAVNWFETLMVVESRRNRQAADKAALLLLELAIQPIVFDRDHIYAAQSAWRRFGKGRHPAALNMSDCAAYATAVIAGEPLLFKGDDFAKTDVARVAWQ